jgi:hypothetical protein
VLHRDPFCRTIAVSQSLAVIPTYISIEFLLISLGEKGLVLGRGIGLQIEEPSILLLVHVLGDGVPDVLQLIQIVLTQGREYFKAGLSVLAVACSE